MHYKRMPIEIESPEQLPGGYAAIKNNLSESSYTDTIFKNLDLNLNDLVICYGDHIGHPGLRSEIIRGEQNLSPEDVLVTAGAAAALFMISTTFLEKGDELVVANPNYATNIETPRAIGADIKFLPMTFENKYQVDLNKLESLITKKTKLVSLTCPHNPTGTMVSESDLKEIIKMVEKNNCHLLFDETYRDMSLKIKLPMAASLSERAISVSSLSKTYGLPGIRIGWLITKDKKLHETFLAAKEQIFICGSVVDEEIAYRYMAKKNQFFPSIKKDMEEKFAITKKWMSSQKYMEWIEPMGGVVCFPRVKKDFNVDMEKFYDILLTEYKSYVGAGHWFEQDKRSMRIGFGWPTQAELKDGLNCVEKAIENCLIK
ncbi:MAG: pyridoxal phosphate-dependent aminotransferase [Bacteriovoracaceae bacterium]